MTGRLTRGGAIEFLEQPLDDLKRLRGYCGSAAVDRSGTIAAATSPHGGVAAFWHLADRRYLGSVELRDGCGIAAADADGGFVFTSGVGMRISVMASPQCVASTVLERPANHLPQWDNHLTANSRAQDRPD
jgi:hypothetical protein